MSIETWAAFAAASAVLLIIPGPTILLVVSYALGQGLGLTAIWWVIVVLTSLQGLTMCGLFHLGLWRSRPPKLEAPSP